MWGAELQEGWFKDGEFQKQNGRVVRHWYDKHGYSIEYDKDGNESKRRYYTCDYD